MKKLIWPVITVVMMMLTFVCLTAYNAIVDWPQRHGESTLSQVKYDLFDQWIAYEGGSLERDIENAEYVWRYYGPGTIVMVNDPYYKHYYKTHELMELGFRLRAKQRVLLNVLADLGADMEDVHGRLDLIDQDFDAALNDVKP